MQTQAERQRALVWRIVRYAITTLAVIVLTTFLFFIMLGYRFDRDTGTIQQGGLVQFISQPTGAKITVGSAQLANPTRSKITLIPGDYLVKMERSGYDLWQKNITVRADTVLWLDSARLVPTNRETVAVQTFKNLDDTLASSSDGRMAFLADDTKPSFSVALLTDGVGQELRSVTIPSDLVARKKGVKHVYSFEEWSPDGRRLLVRHDYGKSREYLLVDTANAQETVVIRAEDSSQPVEAIFDPRSTSELVVRYKDGTVRLIDQDSVSEPILEDVATMTAAKGTLILYSTLPKKGIVKTGYLTLGSNTPKELSTYQTKSKVQLALGDYYFDDYLATAVGRNVTIEKIPTLPGSNEERTVEKVAIARFSLPETPLEVSMRNKSRFIAFSARKHMTTYDLELYKKAEVTIEGKMSSPAAQEWLDNQHFWSDANGNLRQYEYDGTNQADIVKVAPGFSAVYTSSGKYLYSFAKTKDSYVLQRTQMIID